MKNIRVAIVDKREIFRTSIPDILKAEPKIKVVSISQTIHEASKKHSKQQPDIILVSPRCPECGGIEAIRYLHENLPRSSIAVISDYDTIDQLASAMKAGVRAYLPGNISTSNLINAIKLAAEGEIVISSKMLKSLLKMFDSLHIRDYAESSEGASLLTKQENLVVDLVKQGLTNRQIATALVISENTVKVHLRHIMEKLNAHSRQQVAFLLSEEVLLSNLAEIDADAS